MSLKGCYVINLKQCTKRMKNVDSELRKFGIPYERWEALNGKDLGPEFSTQVCRHFCSNGMIGCFASHRSLWEHILHTYDCKSRSDYFLIMEDDSNLRDEFLDVLQNVFDDLKNWNDAYAFPDVIHLSCSAFCREKEVTKNLFQSKTVNSLLCYMVNMNGISKLLHYISPRASYHLDWVMTFVVRSGHVSLYTTPNIVQPTKQTISTVSSSTFPLLPQLVLNLVTGKTHLSIFWESIMISIMGIGFNSTLLLYIILLFVSKRLLGWILLIEVAFLTLKSEEPSTC